MSKRRQRQQQQHQPEPPPHEHEERACARDQFCKTATVVWENDKRIVYPAMVYRAFCERDRDDIVSALVAFPAQYRQLHADLTETRSAGGVSRSPFGPRLPLPADVDAAMRLMLLVLTSWETRVRAIPRIDAPQPEPAPDLAVLIERAATVLHRNVDVLLALEPGWMTRFAPAPRLRDDAITRIPAKHYRDYWDEHRKCLIGEIRILDKMDGAEAGLEILHLHYLCQMILGEIEPKPDNLPGVACYRCGHKALRRADPPVRDDDELYYSRCKVCDHQMTEGGYREHVKRLAAFVGGRERVVLELCAPCCSGAG